MHEIISINDWQTIQTRNYIKRIKESTTVSKASDWAIVLDVFLLFVSFLLDRLFADSPTYVPRYIWLIILFLGFILTGGIILFSRIKKRHLDYLQKILPPYETIVTAFDEEVCYKLMSAASFVDNLQSLFNQKPAKPFSNMGEPLKKFYYSEVIYYLNKAIDILAQYQASLSNILVLDGSETSTKKIDIGRMENVCELIDSIYSALDYFQNNYSFFEAQKTTLEKDRGRYLQFKGDVIAVREKLEDQI